MDSTGCRCVVAASRNPDIQSAGTGPTGIRDLKSKTAHFSRMRRRAASCNRQTSTRPTGPRRGIKTKWQEAQERHLEGGRVETPRSGSGDRHPGQPFGSAPTGKRSQTKPPVPHNHVAL